MIWIGLSEQHVCRSVQATCRLVQSDILPLKGSQTHFTVGGIMGFLMADAVTPWMTTWHDMFHQDVWFVEKILRSILIYVFLLAGIRLGGKRELAQLNAFDLIVLLLLSNTVQNAIIGNDNSLIGGCIGAATLLVLNYVMVRFIHKHRKLDRLLAGRKY
jgi:hypothetical protein